MTNAARLPAGDGVYSTAQGTYTDRITNHIALSASEDSSKPQEDRYPFDSLQLVPGTNAFVVKALDALVSKAKKDGPVRIKAGCHPNATHVVHYDPKERLLILHCGQCRKFVCKIPVKE